MTRIFLILRFSGNCAGFASVFRQFAIHSSVHFVKSLEWQYLNCRADGEGRVPPSRVSVPPSRLSVSQWKFRCPPLRFERQMIRRKDLQIPAEYSSKFRGKSDFEGKSLQLSAKTFFLFPPNFGEKTLQFSAKTFFFWSSCNFGDGIT